MFSSEANIHTWLIIGTINELVSINISLMDYSCYYKSQRSSLFVGVFNNHFADHIHSMLRVNLLQALLTKCYRVKHFLIFSKVHLDALRTIVLIKNANQRKKFFMCQLSCVVFASLGQCVHLNTKKLTPNVSLCACVNHVCVSLTELCLVRLDLSFL